MAYGAPAVVGGASCFSNPTGQGTIYSSRTAGVPFAYAAADVQLTLPDSSSEYNSFHVVQSTRLGQAMPIGGDIFGPTASAASQVQFGIYLTTAGESRNGLLQIVLNDNSLGDPSNGPGSGVFTMGLPLTDADGSLRPSSYGCAISRYTCADPSYLAHFRAQGGFAVPLGTAFYLGYTGSLNSVTGGWSDGNGSGTLDLDFQFRFLEADGSTPVDILQAVPEPSSLGFAVLTAGAASLFFKRRRIQ